MAIVWVESMRRGREHVIYLASHSSQRLGCWHAEASRLLLSHPINSNSDFEGNGRSLICQKILSQGKHKWGNGSNVCCSKWLTQV